MVFWASAEFGGRFGEGVVVGGGRGSGGAGWAWLGAIMEYYTEHDVRGVKSIEAVALPEFCWDGAAGNFCTLPAGFGGAFVPAVAEFSLSG